MKAVEGQGGRGGRGEAGETHLADTSRGRPGTSRTGISPWRPLRSREQESEAYSTLFPRWGDTLATPQLQI